MVLSCSDLNFNTVVVHNLFLCFVVALKTHRGNGFFAPTKVLLKVLVIGNTFGKYC